MKTYLMSHGLTEPQSFFFATILPLMILALLVIWFGKIGVNLKGDTTTRSKVARVGGLVLLWIGLSFAWFWFINWLVPEPVLNAVTDNSQETHDGSWSWFRIMLTLIIVAVFIGPFQKSWKASFFRDQRLASDRKLPLWDGPYWPAVHSALGFALCAIAMVWTYSWYVYVWPIAIAMLLVLWYFGGTPMPENTQRWIQVFAGRHYLIHGRLDRVRFGLWFFSGANDTACPRMSLLGRLLVLPYWFWFTRVDVQSYISFDHPFNVVARTQDGTVVNLGCRLKVHRTCEHPSTFGALPEPEKDTSITDAAEIAANLIVDVLVKATQDQLDAGVDTVLTTSDIPGRITEDVLREKGHLVALGNVGVPMPDEAIVRAQNATAVVREEATQTELKGFAEAKVSAEKELAPAKALAEADPKVRQAYDQITERKRAETIQVNGGAMPTFPIGQQKPKS